MYIPHFVNCAEYLNVSISDLLVLLFPFCSAGSSRAPPFPHLPYNWALTIAAKKKKKNRNTQTRVRNTMDARRMCGHAASFCTRCWWVRCPSTTTICGSCWRRSSEASFTYRISCPRIARVCCVA